MLSTARLEEIKNTVQYLHEHSNIRMAMEALIAAYVELKNTFSKPDLSQGNYD